MKYLTTDSVKHLKVPKIRVDKSYFPEGEVHIQIKENVKNKPVTILSNLTPTNILELLFSVDAAKRAGAKIKKIIIPLMSYTRQDKVYTKGESVSGAVICSLLKNTKTPVITYDIHSELLKKYLSFKNISLLPELAKKLPKKKYLVISPDKGGIKRAKKIAKLLKAKFMYITKTRKNNKIILKFSKSVNDKTILIVDDMISTGTTLIKATKLLKQNGAKEIYCISAHGLFVKNARQKLKAIPIKKIIVSNTLDVKPSKQIQVVKIEPLL